MHRKPRCQLRLLQQPKAKRELANGVANPVDLIPDVRKLSDKVRGIKHLKQLIDVLAE